MKRTLVEDILDRVGRTGLSMNEFAREAGVSVHTIHNARRYNRNLQPKTCWRIAQAYARLRGMTEEEAYAELIVESEIHNPSLAAA
jgi:lambda repressor-like predicted transcriptional regulator